MAFGYEFVTLNDEQKHARRVLLEWYPFVAQLSVLAVFALFQVAYFFSWIINYGLDHERPKSPSFKKHGEGLAGWLRKLRQNFEKLRWWMKKDIKNWGTRGEWIFGGLWTAWLLYLSIVKTDNDYLHLTKRFGIIGASQLPLHYLLAMRSPYSPVQVVTRLSHEELKASHQVLGRIVLFLFVLHAVFYMNFFIVSGFLAKRIRDKDVIFGIVSLILFGIIGTTALGQLRRWNYRVFYISHVTIANFIVIPLFLHVTHIRLYVYEVIAVNAIHLVLRGLGLKTYSGTIKLLPGTNLVQVRIPLSADDAALKWKPGQHVYLSRPSGKSYSTSVADQFVLRNQTNPFTVASIPGKDHELLLVARTLNGNTKHLANLAKSLAGSDEAPGIPLALEGPYGSSTRLPDFTAFDKVLLVAGGVGATFIVPIYRSIVESSEYGQIGGSQVRFIWAVRKLAETQWALPVGKDEDDHAGPLHSSVAEVFVTRPSGANLQTSDAGEDIELAEDEHLLSMEEQMERPRKGMTLQMGRPNMSAIVDEVCSKGSRVAVLVCGPKALSEEVSKCAEQWVYKGCDVYWHDETFGW